MALRPPRLRYGMFPARRRNPTARRKLPTPGLRLNCGGRDS